MPGLFFFEKIFLLVRFCYDFFQFLPGLIRLYPFCSDCLQIVLQCVDQISVSGGEIVHVLQFAIYPVGVVAGKKQFHPVFATGDILFLHDLRKLVLLPGYCGKKLVLF